MDRNGRPTYATLTVSSLLTVRTYRPMLQLVIDVAKLLGSFYYNNVYNYLRTFPFHSDVQT